MLTKKTPETIKASLKHKAQGVENSLLLTYHNRTPEQFKEFVGNPENLTIPTDNEKSSDVVQIAHINASLVLFLVKSFDDGTDKDFPLTRDGLIDLEQHWPGTLMALVSGYHQARSASVEKN